MNHDTDLLLSKTIRKMRIVWPSVHSDRFCFVSAAAPAASSCLRGVLGLGQEAGGGAE